MSSNQFQNICLTPEQLNVFAGSNTELYLQRYLFPVLSFFGIVGNALNLTVLLRRTSSQNLFLTTMAISDICFLILIIPNQLINYSFFHENDTFRIFFYYTRQHLRGLCNFASALTSWSMVFICFYRLLGIRKPLLPMAFKKSLLINIVIFISSGLITFYTHIEYSCPIRIFCQGKQVYSQCRNVRGPWFKNLPNPHSSLFITIIDAANIINVVVIILIPIITLIVLNVFLLLTLKKRRITWKLLNDNLNNNTRASKTDLLRFQNIENRVTITVALIVSSFIFTNLPSAVMTITKMTNISQNSDYFKMFDLLANTLVIIGKTCNFFWFCMSSKNFRRKIFALCQKKIHGRMDNITLNLLDTKIEVSKIKRISKFFSKEYNDKQKKSTSDVCTDICLNHD
uniref:G_PROTEIN_RECEP_F1_2 domain-containing protein n=1 Tax=Rhabditophanes sp. KR3021 TaxID=114890 RepID=A0AC35UIG1_9BILA